MYGGFQTLYSHVDDVETDTFLYVIRLEGEAGEKGEGQASEDSLRCLRASSGLS